MLDPSKLFKITIYSHFFKVTGYQARMTPILNKFYDKYAQMGFAKDDRGRNVYRPLRHFGIVNHIKREYRYHIGQLSDFMRLLEFHYIVPELYEVETIPLYESQKYKLERTEGWQLREYQQQAHDFIVDHSVDDLHTRLIAIHTGGGKDQPLTEPIYTPNGWKFMGEMKIGDKVYTRTGQIVTVNGVFPQGEQQVYRVYFEDGRYTDCGLGHLWKVYYATKEKSVNILETNDIIKNLTYNTLKDRMYIDLYKPEEGIDKDLIIDPYLLGYLLGNGGLTTGTVGVTIPDKWTVDHITQLLPSELKIRYNGRYDYNITRVAPSGNNILTDKLRTVGIFGLYSYNKKIPSIY